MISHYIREIGRGRDGARSLSRDQARDLLEQVFSGQVSDLELGAFCLAMRIKGESLDELVGFLDAVQAHIRPFQTGQAGPAVILPCYNGARRLPALTPLLAGLLAREGIPVVAQGIRHDPGRGTTTAEVFDALGWPVAEHAQDVFLACTRQEPVFIPIETLHPALNRLLQVRRIVGLRNPGHTLAKLLLPVQGRQLRLVPYTHPAYGEALAAMLSATHADALLARGTEGEPVSDLRKLRPIQRFVSGNEDLAQEPSNLADSMQDSAPHPADATETARFTAEVLADRMPPPPAVAHQAALIRATLDRLSPT